MNPELQKAFSVVASRAEPYRDEDVNRSRSKVALLWLRSVEGADSLPDWAARIRGQTSADGASDLTTPDARKVLNWMRLKLCGLPSDDVGLAERRPRTLLCRLEVTEDEVYVHVADWLYMEENPRAPRTVAKLPRKLFEIEKIPTF